MVNTPIKSYRSAATPGYVISKFLKKRTSFLSQNILYLTNAYRFLCGDRVFVVITFHSEKIQPAYITLSFDIIMRVQVWHAVHKVIKLRLLAMEIS